MIRKKLLSTAVILTTILSFSAYGQKPLTGTRINSAGASNARTVIRFQEPHEVSLIERLLARGKSDEALEMALQWVEQVDRAGMDVHSRYFAHNSLCVVYTNVREDSKAEKECNRAIEIRPGHWSAWNNRGAIRYLAGDMAGAKKDYQRALGKAGNQNNVVEMLRHNLALVDFELRHAEQYANGEGP